MAQNTTIKNLERELKAKEQEIQALEAQRNQSNAAQINAQIRGLERQLNITRNILATEIQRKKEQDAFINSFTSYSKRYTKFNSDVQNQLKGQNSSASVYLNLGKSIAEEKKRQVKYENATSTREKDLYERSMQRDAVYSNISQKLEEQAKATARAEQDLRGISDIDKQIEEIKKSQGLYNTIQKKELIDALQLTKELALKEERIKQIKQEQQELFEALPEPIRNAVGFAKKLGTALKNGALPIVLIASLAIAAISSFTKLDDAAADFRKETGLTNSQMKEIRSQANEVTGEFANLGVEAKNVFDTVAALKSSFSDVANFSKETVAALTVLNQNFGIAAEDSAKVQGIFEQIGGLSSETAANVQMQAANMANLAGVAPAKVFKDIAENAEVASTIFKGDLTKLTKNAVEARRLGTNLKEVAATAEKLLDFESSIEDELTAATFVGGQFNLSRARALAMEGNIVDAQKETLAQIQRSGDFRKQDFFTQKQLAKASGMSVEQIVQQLNAQEKLNNLTSEQRKQAEEAINAGLDITNISADQLAQETQKFKVQQENQKQTEQLANAFTSIAATIGSVLTPVLEGLIPIVTAILTPIQYFAKIIGEVLSNMYILVPLVALLAIHYKKAAIAAMKERAASIGTAIANIFSGQGKIPFAGIALAAAGVAAMISLIAKSNQVGDLMSPADGATRVSTKEGGLFELSPNDDLVAAPGAAAALAGGTAAMPNLAVLSAPLNAMIGELKALRADLAAGKISVNMDGVKVASGIGKVVDGSTRNNFAMAQA